MRPLDHLDDDAVRRKLATVQHWYHQIELRPGLVTPGTNPAREVLALLDLPQDCSGLRVLDLGARDGFFTFELERRGAEVVSVDYVPDTATGFRVCADLLGSRAQFVHANIYDLSAETLGRFDIVLFLGLIYHLPDPIEALHRVRSVAKGRLCLESHVIDNAFLLSDGRSVPLSSISQELGNVPLMQFYAGRSLNNDPTNYWGPNLACLRAMLSEALFEVRSASLLGTRGIVNAVAVEDPDVAIHNEMARTVRGVS